MTRMTRIGRCGERDGGITQARAPWFSRRARSPREATDSTWGTRMTRMTFSARVNRLFLQEHQHVLPVLPATDDVVLPDTQVHSLFYDQIVAAQQQDPELATIVKQLSDPMSARSSEFRTLYVVTDGVLGVRAPDGNIRTVIPSGPLRAAVCRFFHDEAGHPGVQRTL